jgi:hypothetical protein
MTKSSIATAYLGGAWMKSSKAIAAAGFRGVEIFESDCRRGTASRLVWGRAMADLFFIKIVERRGYLGFGQ